MKPLRPLVLAVTTLVAGVLSWAGARLWNSVGSLPGVPAAAPIVLAVIAVVLAAAAIMLRGRLAAQRERRPEAKAVDPLFAARALVLGQASALVAALVTGVYGGMGVFLITLSGASPARQSQALTALFAVLAGVAVMAAGLWLQHICRLPEDEDQDHERSVQRR
ncbi:membrane protein implicated in regulation of membrane protease activity [Streptacidiphilus sp. MAP12-33]|uniref:DUF3180 domain-containing protein n=1 Tax=Streptacidiphilus sp. MAP12-33 TaxID=3156266 RepID=UPI00351456CC